MTVDTTIDATVPSGTSGQITYYEDINSNSDGTQTDKNGRAYNNEQTITLQDGTNTYVLDNLVGSSSSDYWFDLDISNTDREAGLVINSVDVNADATTRPPGTGTLEWTTETEFDNIRDQVGIATDGLGLHPSAGSAFQGYPYGDLRKELLLYFPFDDDKSTTTAQNAAHGEPGKLDTVSFSTDALVQSKSLSFTSAGSSVSIQRYSQAEVEDGVFTASVAFKVSAASVTGEVMLFGDKDITGTNDTAGFAITLENSSGTVNINTYAESTTGTLRTGSTSGTNFGDSSWHVVVLSKTDDNTYDIYVDGNRRYGMGSNGDISSTNEFRVGIAHDGSSNDYRGLLEEVRLYGKAFSQVEAERLFTERSSDYQTTSNLECCIPIARYDFEGTGSVATDSQGANDGTITGAARATDRVIGDTSIEFTTDTDYVEIPNLVGVEAEWSAAGWVNINSVDSDSTIIGRWATSDSLKSFLLYWDAGNNYIRSLIHDGSSSNSIETTTKTLDDTWVHVAVTYSSSAYRIYYNGKLEASITPSVSPQSTTNLYLGSEDDSSSRALIGLLDDMRFYDVELTPARIERIYNFQQPRLPENNTPESGLNGWLPLNESTGDAIDLAAGNDGTVNGPTQGAVGLQGTTSYSFDGTNDFIELVNNYYSLPISVTAWAINNQADGTRRDIINFRDNLGLIISTGVNGTNTIDIWDGSWTEVGSYTANEWFHVVTIINSGGLTEIYINESLSAVENLSITSASPNRNVLGMDPNNLGHWDGRIGEVRTYRRRLRPSEIDLLYRRGNINLEQATTDPELAKFSGAVGRWSFDDADISSGTLSDTYGANDGTINGSPTTGVDGIGEGEAITFSSSGDSIRVTNPDSTLDMDEWSVSQWFKPDSTQESIVSIKRDNGNPNQNFATKLFSNGIVRVNHTISNSFTSTDTPADTYIANDWNHCVAINDGTDILIYVNGTLVAVGQGNGGISDQGASQEFWIAQNTNGGDQFTGEIDEVRIFNRSLDSHEVWQLYSLGRNQNWVTHNE